MGGGGGGGGLTVQFESDMGKKHVFMKTAPHDVIRHSNFGDHTPRQVLATPLFFVSLLNL